MREIKFAKMVAAGNDFVVIDNRADALLRIGMTLSDFAKEACQRKLSIGADGLIILERSLEADFKMRIFNPDGTEPAMCGNGARCASLLARKRNIVGNHFRIETKAGIIEADVYADKVKIALTNPRELKLNIPLKIDNDRMKVHFLDTGVPHAVIMTKELSKVDVKALGSKIRRHNYFKPGGANVNFVEVLDKKNIKVRTYERGVEDETYACGTGSVASAIVAAAVENSSSPVSVHTYGGDTLKVFFDMSKSRVKNVFLEGEARIVFQGVLVL